MRQHTSTIAVIPKSPLLFIKSNLRAAYDGLWRLLQGCFQDERAPQTSSQELSEAAGKQGMSQRPPRYKLELCKASRSSLNRKGHSKAVKVIKSRQSGTYVAQIQLGFGSLCLLSLFLQKSCLNWWTGSRASLWYGCTDNTNGADYSQFCWAWPLQNTEGNLHRAAQCGL